MGAAGFDGSFSPIVQYEKWEIHPVFPHFSYFRLGQNLSPNLLDPLCGIALMKNHSIRSGFPFGGLEGIRTLDPHNANVVRSQLRYKPIYSNLTVL